jgi:hypothetical protein
MRINRFQFVFMDRLDIHCFTVDVLEEALKQKIHFVGLPSNTSHFLQPLDVAVFGPFKQILRERCNELAISNEKHRIRPSVRQVVPVVDSVWRCIKASTIKKGKTW